MPRRVCPHDGVENREQFAHTGREREFLRLARRKETAVESADDRIATGRDERPHVEHGPHRCPPTPHDPLASERATVAGEGCDTDQGSDLFAVQVSELRHVGDQRATHHRPHARHTAKEILFGAPDRTARNRVVEVVIDSRDPSLEPADVLHQTTPNRTTRVLQPIPLRGQHVQQLSAARHQRVQLLDDGVRERARRGPHPVGKERQEVGIQVVGLGEWPVAFAKSRTCRGFATTIGRFAAASAATTTRSYPQSPRAR